MQTATLFGVLLAALFSLLLVLWQYYFKTKNRGRLSLLLASLRFIAIFGVLLLLLNPKIRKESFITEKQDLIILLDDSKSIAFGEADEQLRDLKAAFLENEELPDRFNIRNYSFGRTLGPADSLSFSSEVSDISGALNTVNQIYTREKALVVLITDGNQTFGEAYEYLGNELDYPVFPIVIGDTTRYTDLKINQVNLNKYAFLKNRFPIELFVGYQGEEAINSRLTIRMDGVVVHREGLELNPEQNSRKISISLEAQSVGLKMIEVTLDSLAGEKNVLNNKRRIPIEVIDEKTRVGLISEVMHPDLGALIKAIESNDQRSVSLLKPLTAAEELSNFDMLILYQPTRSFDGIYQFLQQSGMNTFTLTGPGTDWRYLNREQKGLEIGNYNQTEEILPVVNPAFGLFDLSDFTVEDFPPLLGSLGEILITKPYESILDQQIKGVILKDPLLPIISDENGRHAYLFGENIWKWRVQSFRNDQDFTNFDGFINKIILYLTSDGKRDRLTVNYEQLYSAVTEKKIKASFFDPTYVFDRDATINLMIRGVDIDYSSEQTMILNNSQYEADLRDLPAGEYTFSVTVDDENFETNGRFSIEDFNLEQLFVSSDFVKLSRLSEGSGGKLYYPAQLENLITEINNDPRFYPTQKSVENVVSLIDFKIVFGIIIAAFAAEWFIRKYNGLI